jgi:hypothetical protein
MASEEASCAWGNIRSTISCNATRMARRRMVHSRVERLGQNRNPVTTVRGRATDMARFSDRELYAISRNFSRLLSQRREPDGEVPWRYWTG